VELRDYARAIARRWAWGVAGGAAGMALAGAVALLAPVSYQAGVALYVDAALVVGDEDPSSAARVRTTVLPSVAQLVRSESVLAAAADRLDLADPPARLAADVDVVTDSRTSVLRITATRSRPADAVALAGALGAEVRAQAQQLYAGADGSLLQVTAVRSSADAVSTARSVTVLVLGAGAGAGAAGVAAGLAELIRPRVRGRRDVARLGPAPVLALLPLALPSGPRSRRPDGPAQRAEALALVRLSLSPVSPDRGGRRIALVGAGTTATTLAAELRTSNLVMIAVESPRSLAGLGGVDAVLVVADGRHTTAADLETTLAAVRAAGAPLAGVVVDGVLPSGARWRDTSRAGLCGHPVSWLEAREEASTDAGATTSLPIRLTAALAVAAVGFTHPLPMTLSAGLIASGALLPVWLPLVGRYRGLRLLLLLTGAGLLSGVLLAWNAAADHGFAPHEAGVRTSLVLGAVGGVGVILWAKQVLPVPAIGVCFGLSMLATEFLTTSVPGNVWKFQLSSPLMIIGLALAARWGKPLLTVAVLAVLGLLNVTNDARSAFGFCALAACLVLWQLRPRRDPAPRRMRPLLALPLLAALAAGAYWLLTQLILAGGLGSEIQARSEIQIAQTGSLILGGRPEWTATWALMQLHPFGFGLGVVPNSEDVLVAKAGIEVTNIPTADDYLLHVLLNGSVQLHSILADLWAGLGPAGLLLGLAMGALIVLGFMERLGRRQASGLVCLLVPMALWNLAFGPLSSNGDTLILALGLLLVARPPVPRRAGAPGVPVGNPAPADLRGRGLLPTG
jgi:capsular polysaccharide biosynthesis protein